jgi:hypothetical protein
MRALVAMLLLLLVPGCNHVDVESGIFFPTFDASGALPGAIVTWTLFEESNCLFIDAGGGQRALVLWEDGMGYESGQLLDGGGASIAGLGEIIHGGGGWYSDRSHIEGLAGKMIPDRCVLDGPDRFVLIYDVESGTPD